MTQIAFLGNFNVDYSSESHHAKTLEKLGHTVIRLQEGQAKSEEIFEVAKKSDLFVWVHTHGWKTAGRIPMNKILIKLKNLGVPTITYHLDLWFGLKRQNDLRNDSFYKTIGHFFIPTS